MNEKWNKKIQIKLVRIVLVVGGVFVIGGLVYGFVHKKVTPPLTVHNSKQQKPSVQKKTAHEAGFTPNMIVWNHRIYKITNQEIHDVGEKLGDATGANELKSIHRDVYRIPDIDPSEKVAVPIPIDTYVIFEVTK